MGRRLAVSVLAASLLSIAGWSTAAFAYPIGPVPTISTGTSSIEPCAAVTVTLSGFQPSETVTLTLDGTSNVLRTATTDATGALSVSLTLPTGTSLGTHSIVATGASGDTATTAITVAGSCAVPVAAISPSGLAFSPSGLAFTGADIAAIVGVGSLALGVGGMLMLATRRRRASDSKI